MTEYMHCIVHECICRSSKTMNYIRNVFICFTFWKNEYADIWQIDEHIRKLLYESMVTDFVLIKLMIYSFWVWSEYFFFFSSIFLSLAHHHRSEKTIHWLMKKTQRISKWSFCIRFSSSHNVICMYVFKYTLWYEHIWKWY